MTYEAWRISFQSSEQAARFAWEECQKTRRALARLRASISDYGGHGNPGCPDRAEAYIAIAEADSVLTHNAEIKGAR